MDQTEATKMRPPTATRYMLTLVGGLVVGGTAGYITGRLADMGHRFGGLAEMHAEELRSHVETLSLLRLGETERGIRLLETLVDGEIMIVAQPGSIPLAGRPDHCGRTLGQAKAYRQKYPSNDAQVRDALQRVPEARIPKDCDSGFCRLLKVSDEAPEAGKSSESQAQRPAPPGGGPR